MNKLLFADGKGFSCCRCLYVLTPHSTFSFFLFRLCIHSAWSRNSKFYWIAYMYYLLIGDGITFGWWRWRIMYKHYIRTKHVSFFFSHLKDVCLDVRFMYLLEHIFFGMQSTCGIMYTDKICFICFRCCRSMCFRRVEFCFVSRLPLRWLRHHRALLSEKMRWIIYDDWLDYESTLFMMSNTKFRQSAFIIESLKRHWTSCLMLIDHLKNRLSDLSGEKMKKRAFPELEIFKALCRFNASC